MLGLVLGALAALLIVFAPKKPSDEVVVLPGPDGRVTLDYSKLHELTKVEP